MEANTNNTQHIFAERLKKLRIEAGLSQDVLAKKLGVSRGSISFYENCDRIPDIIFLVSASSLFGVSPDYLLGISNVPTIDKDQRLSAACEATGLSYEAILQIIDIRKCGDIELLSALLENPLFTKAVSNVYKALSCKYLKTIVDDTAILESEISQHIRRLYSLFSGNVAITPRLVSSESFLQTAQEYFKEAASEAIEIVKNNHSMDEKLLRGAEREISAFIEEMKFFIIEKELED